MTRKILFSGLALALTIAGCNLMQRHTTSDDGLASRKTTRVEYLTSPVRLGDLYLRDNAGVFEFSPDGGAWSVVGSGSGSSSEYALRGTGAGYIAYATFLTPSGFFTGNTAFSLVGVVMVDQLDRAESFYQHVETEYSTNVLNFGKTSDNRLQVTLGANTYTSGVVWTADTIGVPVEVGVVCDAAGTALWFIFHGEAFASQAAAYTFPAINGGEVHALGSGLDGDIFFFSVTKGLLFAAATKHRPMSEGLSQCPYCLAHYDCDEGDGATLTDRYVEQKGSGASHSLTIEGDWQDYQRGY